MKDLSFLKDKRIFSKDYTVKMNNASYFQTIKLAHLFRYLQEVAGLHTEAMKTGYHHLRAQNGAWVLTKQLMEIDRLPNALEEFTIHTWSNKYSKIVANRNFIVTDSKGKSIIKVSTDWIVLNLLKRRILPLTKIDLSSTKSYNCEVFSHDLTKIELIKDNPVNSFTKKVRFSDIDFNGHMNNTRYVDLAIDSVADRFSQRNSLKSINTNFIREVSLDDEIMVNCYQCGEDTYQHQLVRVNDEQEVFTAETIWNI